MRWGDKDGDGRVGAQEFSSMMMETMREAFKIEKEKKCDNSHNNKNFWTNQAILSIKKCENYIFYFDTFPQEKIQNLLFKY